ncbi:hypothetical protein CFB3_25460 [Clostridium folliculivorans]|nr:hypothetical protein CFB3_25460 [Clostridium folliculivorans]
MDYSVDYGEIYTVTDYTKKIYDLIKKGIFNYTKEDIKYFKENILNEIVKKQEEIYIQDDLQYKFESRVNEINKLNELDLEDIIYAIKERYIIEEALMQLINECKLIPVDNIRPMSQFLNGADILVDVKHNKGNKCLYFYLDLISTTKFRVSRTVFI